MSRKHFKRLFTDYTCNIKNSRLHGYACDFSVDCDAIVADDILEVKVYVI